jgi:hypothetical protein
MKSAFFFTLALSLSGMAYAEPPALPPAADTNPQEAGIAPVPITMQAMELGTLLEGAGWVHKGAGRVPVYVIGFRSCPDCISQKMVAGDAMENAGADLRHILYARPDGENGKQRSKPGERAMVAELWKNRDYNLYKSWYDTDPDTFYATGDLPPPADGDPQRMAYVETSRAFVTSLNDILKANNIQMYVPIIFWRENGQWMAYVGFNRDTFSDLVISRFSHL